MNLLTVNRSVVSSRMNTALFKPRFGEEIDLDDAIDACEVGSLKALGALAAFKAIQAAKSLWKRI